MISIELELVVFQLYSIGFEVFLPASLITVPMISWCVSHLQCYFQYFLVIFVPGVDGGLVVHFQPLGRCLRPSGCASPSQQPAKLSQYLGRHIGAWKSLPSACWRHWSPWSRTSTPSCTRPFQTLDLPSRNTWMPSLSIWWVLLCTLGGNSSTEVQGDCRQSCCFSKQ